MKFWFPFTSYDFYAYLTTGLIVLACVDHTLLGSVLANEAEWNLINGTFWAAIAYLVGQIVAIPSSLILEQFFARYVLHSPTLIVLGLEAPRWREMVVRWGLGAREYEPFPEKLQSSIMAKLSKELDCPVEQIEGEAAFQCAFPHARASADSATRLDNFINLYGMCRNVSTALIISAMLLVWSAISNSNAQDWTYALLAIVLAGGMFGRFVKFYAAYAREVLRSFNKSKSITE